MSRASRLIVTLLLALLGVEAWLTLGGGLWDQRIHVKLAVFCFIVAIIRPAPRLIYRQLIFLRRPSRLARLAISVFIALASAASFTHAATRSGRDLFPVMHDEFQFLLQARMLASGRLWMPGHPLARFFDTFYVLIQPRYAAQSFPGTAFFFLPTQWMPIAPWAWAIVLASLTLAMFYLVVTQLIDGIAALAGAALLASLPLTQFISTEVIAQTPALFLGLGIVWLFDGWQRQPTHWKAACIGLLAGLALITRPIDALVFLIPVAIAFALSARGRSRLLKSLAWFTLAAFPSLILQLVFNHGVTGHWLQTPFALYNERDQPGVALGLYPQPGIPQTQLPEKLAYYHQNVLPLLAKHRPDQFWHTFVTDRLPLTLQLTLPHPFLIALLPLGAYGIFRRRAWLLGITPALFLLLYTPYPLFVLHYPAIASAGAILLVLAGVDAIAHALPRWAPSFWVATLLFAVGLLFFPPTPTGPMLGAVLPHSPILRVADDAARSLAGHRSIILFARSPGVSTEYEPVFNLQAAYPDQCQVIRAHDLGPANIELFRYYDHLGQNRAVYRFDEANLDHPLTYLGEVSNLARTASQP